MYGTRRQLLTYKRTFLQVAQNYFVAEKPFVMYVYYKRCFTEHSVSLRKELSSDATFISFFTRKVTRPDSEPTESSSHYLGLFIFLDTFEC